MVEERVTDGVRVAELLASEVTGRSDGPLAGLAVTDADPAVEPTTDGALAYSIVGEVESEADDAGAPTLVEVYVHPDRARVEFVAAAGDDAGETATDSGDGDDDADAGAADDADAGAEAEADTGGGDDDADAGAADAATAAVEAVAAADRADLRARPKAVRPPRTLVFVESGAAVKAAVDVLAAAAAADGSEQ